MALLEVQDLSKRFGGFVARAGSDAASARSDENGSRPCASCSAEIRVSYFMRLDSLVTPHAPTARRGGMGEARSQPSQCFCAATTRSTEAPHWPR